MPYLHIEHSVSLESGATLPSVTIAYHTFGQLNARRDNVIWVCHALTANSDVADWWEDLLGPGRALDPERHFIVCANMLGSCYGTTGPDSIDPNTGTAYKDAFPLITIRDIVHVHQLLAKHLEIETIRLLIGGSMGGQQALEWAIDQPQRIKQLCVLATNARHSAWGIAFNEAQRMALTADGTRYENGPEAGKAGLIAARAIAMLSYRHFRTYAGTQTDADINKIDGFRASSYQQYQGLKLWNRFSPFAYWSLSKSMDSHNVGRNRGSLESALQRIQAQTLVIGIDTDILFPLEDQAEIVRQVGKARLSVIHSDFGHDGFLTEAAKVSRLLRPFLDEGGLDDSEKSHAYTNALVGRRLALPGTEAI